MTLLPLRRACALLLAAGACAGLAACGSDDSSGSSSSSKSTPAATKTAASGGGGAAAERLTIAATESGGALGFSKKKLAAKAGKVTITMDNPSGNQQPHAIEIEGQTAGEIAQPGAKSTVTADLKPGTYTFFCPVGQHRQAGMEGELTIK